MRNSLLAGVLMLAATAAQASTPSFYIGAGVAEAKVDNIDESGRNFDIDNAGWKAFAGFRPIGPLGIEVNYMDLGSQTRNFDFGTLAHADARAFAAYAVGFLPIPLPFFDVFGKAGLARWQLDGHTNSSFFALDDRGTDFAWGGGAQAYFGNFGARLEYEQFNIRNSDGVKLVTFDVLFKFL